MVLLGHLEILQKQILVIVLQNIACLLDWGSLRASSLLLQKDLEYQEIVS